MSRDWADPAQPRHRAGAAARHRLAVARRPTQLVEGRLWGGCLEIVDFQLRAGRYLLEDAAYDGCVLFLETSEELPTAQYVGEVLMCLGERGLLQRFSGAAHGPAAGLALRHAATTRRSGRRTSRRSTRWCSAAMAEYSPDVPVVLDVDLGHTDPQLVVPYGGECRIDPVAPTVSVRY